MDEGEIRCIVFFGRGQARMEYQRCPGAMFQSYRSLVDGSEEQLSVRKHRKLPVVRADFQRDPEVVF
jgi:hypothetical protein